MKVDGVQQVIDKFLDERLRSATSDVASNDAQADAYTRLEAAMNELGSNNLSSSLTTFFGGLQDALEVQPVRSAPLDQPPSRVAQNIDVRIVQRANHSLGLFFRREVELGMH